jgi:hypothetical protein
LAKSILGKPEVKGPKEDERFPGPESYNIIARDSIPGFLIKQNANYARLRPENEQK